MDYEKAVREKIEYRPRLIPVFTSDQDIPERIREYNAHMFVCFNRVEQRYEVHSLDQVGDSYCTTLPYKELDVRSVRFIWENDIRVHGEEIFRRLDREEAKREKQKAREYQNWVRDVASETQGMFAKDAWK